MLITKFYLVPVITDAKRIKMSTLVTPSAKAHERVTGRWNQNIQAISKRDWSSYYVKVICGTPISWFITGFLFLSFMNPFANDILAWVCALLTVIYIIADRFSGTKEFSFFPIGVDLAVGFFIFVVLVNSIFESSETIMSILSFRWILLPYIFAYMLELFPGLNNMLHILFAGALFSSAYAFVQHFTGFELMSGRALEFAPLKGFSYYCVAGFSQLPEVFGSLIAMLLPFPVCCYLSAEKRNSKMMRGGALALSFILMLAIFWTYRPGIWIASLSGVLICLIVQSQRQFKFMLATIVFFFVTILISYQSPQPFIQQIKERESIRAGIERNRINELFAQFSQAPFFGMGIKPGPDFYKQADPLTLVESKMMNTNIYFELLAQIGIFGTFAYFAMILPFLLFSYRLFKEIPASHFWHRVMASSITAGQVSFHLSGLYWGTLSHSSVTNLFSFYMAVAAYLHHHYMKGLVPDDRSL
jgi:hypothetical protein